MEKGLFFDGVAYSADDMVSYLGNLAGDGVIIESGNELKVMATDSTHVKVLSGVAYLSGYCYKVDTEGVSLAVAAQTGSARTDLVVLQLDYAAKTLRAVVRQGESIPLASELPLARLSVAENGISVIDMRQRAMLKTPWRDQNIPKYYPVDTITVTGVNRYAAKSLEYIQSYEEAPNIFYIVENLTIPDSSSIGGMATASLCVDREHKKLCLDRMSWPTYSFDYTVTFRILEATCASVSL